MDAMRKVRYIIPNPPPFPTLAFFLHTPEFSSRNFDAILTHHQTKQIKQAFDPLCLLNCDKVVRMQKPKAGEVAEW